MKREVQISIAFLVFCVAVFLLNDSYRIIQLRPQSVHVWRQTDCLSYTLNYYQNNQPFFEPQTHTLLGDNGRTVSEFPILYFITAKFYQVFGPQESILRIINFLIFAYGCFCLLWLGFEIMKNKWLAFIPAAITFTSPYLYYYALNFLPDVPALSLALAGTFFLFRYLNTQRIRWAYLSAAMFCLGALLKISAGISLVALISVLLLFVLIKNEKHVPKKHYIHLFFLLVFIVGINLAWVEYAKYYNLLYKNRQNLLGIFPIWGTDMNDVYDIALKTIQVWSKVILHPVVWCWVFGLSAMIVMYRKTLSGFHQMILGFMVLGALVYSLLWYQAFMHHDYYMVNPFIAIVWTILTACLVADKATPLFRKTFLLVAGLIVCISVYQSRAVQIERYATPDPKYLNTDLFTIEPYLRSIGISRYDRIVSVPDPSANISLYFMNQPGWTELFDKSDYPFERSVDSFAKYLITSDTDFIRQPKYEAHKGDLAGNYGSYYIYRIRK